MPEVWHAVILGYHLVIRTTALALSINLELIDRVAVLAAGPISLHLLQLCLLLRRQCSFINPQLCHASRERHYLIVLRLAWRERQRCVATEVITERVLSIRRDEGR